MGNDMAGDTLRDKVFLINTVVLFLMLVTALTNTWQIYGYFVGLNLALWLVIGAMKENEFGPALWLGSSLFVIWVVCISLIFHYWAAFRGVLPSFTIAGMHPGFFVLFPVMWLLVFSLGTLSYALVFDKWILSEQDWEEFHKKIKEGKTWSTP